MLDRTRLDLAWERSRTLLEICGHGVSYPLNYPRHDVVMMQTMAVDLELMCARAWNVGP